MNTVQMFNDPRKCYLLWDFEAEYDTGNPAQAMQALGAAEKVIAFCSFATDSTREVADILLPVAPLAESEGSLVNLDGSTMKYAPAGKVSGEARSGWKILRRLGNDLGLEGFNQVSLSELQAQKGDGQSIILSNEQQTEIRNFEKEVVKTRQLQKQVRRNREKEIKKLGMKIKLINILLMPVIVAAAGILFYAFRRSRTRA